MQPAPGGLYTINPGTFDRNYIQTHGSSMRQIMGMDGNATNPHTHLIINPPGQIGIIGQVHYVDQVFRWLHGDYYQMLTVNANKTK